MEDILDKKSRQFQRKGWNGNGSRMLAAACLVAEMKSERCKRNLAEKDIMGLLLIVGLVLKYSTNSILILLIAALSISYGMKKLLKTYDLSSVLEDLESIFGRWIPQTRNTVTSAHKLKPLFYF